MDRPVVCTRIVRVDGVRPSEVWEDFVAVEEPLEIQLGYDRGGWRVHKSISITMRTPGADADLAVGFLFTEGIISGAGAIAAVGQEETNVVRVELRDGTKVDLRRLERHFYTTSSCGVCGKASIAALNRPDLPTLSPSRPSVEAATVHKMPGCVRETQEVFEQTGGLHAAGLFDADGNMIAVREDVGRHNAVDKLIGSRLRAGEKAALGEEVLFVSSRASFELVQKALAAGIAVLAAVGAPSSLAVGLAQAHGMTLLGFVRGGRFNIYAGERRIQGLAAGESALADAAVDGCEVFAEAV